MRLNFFEFELNRLPLYACVMPMGINADKILIVDRDKGVSDAVSGVVNYAHLIAILFAVTAILFVLAVLYLNRRHNLQLLQVAYHDRLTGAYNRYKFFQLLDQQRKKNAEYSVAAINIRKFKYINEQFSASRPDRLLKEISAMLKQCMEPGEFFCRDAADTFLMCLNTWDRDTAVAEGVETEDHVCLMQKMGCDYGHGYYYSRPIPAAEFTDTFLKTNATHSFGTNDWV